MTAVTSKRRLVLVESTDDRVEEARQKGLWSRHCHTLSRLSESFEIQYFTSDRRPFQEDMPQGVVHRVSPFSPSIYGLRHVAYYLFLIFDSMRWKRSADVINIVGVNQPIVPFVRFFSRLKVLTVFHYEWAAVTSTNYRWYQPKTLLSPVIQHLSLSNSDCIMCTTDRLLEQIRKRYPRIPVRLVPNYVNTTLFTPELHKKKQIVFVGRLHWSKGIDTLLEAFVALLTTHPDYELIIIGSGEESERLQATARGIHQIRFAGPTPYAEVAAILNASQVFVLPSKTMEGLPRAMIEAMAAGCRCVASDVPGNHEIMHEMNCSDYLFAPGDVQSLADRLASAISRSDDTRQYAYAVSRFAEGVVLKQYAAALMEFTRQDYFPSS